MSVVNNCFEILAKAENIDEAMDSIKQILLAENIDNAQTRLQIEANPLDYLVRNISVRAVQTVKQLEEQEAQEAELHKEQSRLESEFIARQKELPESERRAAQAKHLEAKENIRAEELKRMEELRRARESEYQDSVRLRIENFQNFVRNPQSKKWFNQPNYLGQPLLVVMLSNFMIWPKDVIFAVLDMAENVSEIRARKGRQRLISDASTFSEGKEDVELSRLHAGAAFAMPAEEEGYNMLEYLINQQAFDGVEHAPQFALRLVELGCELRYRNSEETMNNFVSNRSLQSGVTEALLVNSIRAKDASLLCAVVGFFEKKVIQSYSNPASSLVSRSPSRAGIGISDSSEMVKKMLSRVIKIEGLDINILNSDGVSIARFFIERSVSAANTNSVLPISAAVWSTIQSQDVLKKLGSKIFEVDPEFFVSCVKTKQSALMKWVMDRVNSLGEVRADILKESCYGGETPFLTACRIACSNDIVEMLLPKDKVSLEEGLRICARKGFCLPMNLILNYAAEQGITDIDFSTILFAAITHNQETFVGDLLKRGVDPNLVSSMQSPEGGVVLGSALEAAVVGENNTLIAMLIEAGARFKDLAEYQEYKSKVSPKLREEFEEKEKGVAEKVKDFAQSKLQIEEFIRRRLPKEETPPKILDLALELSEAMIRFNDWHDIPQRAAHEDLHVVVINLPGLVATLQESKKTITDEMIERIRQGGVEGLRGVIKEAREASGSAFPSASPAVAGAAAAANFGRGGGGAGKALNP